jgi:hypothetical protein
MNKFTAFTAVVMFVLGAVTGHSMNAPAPAVPAAAVQPSSAFELMQNAVGLPETTVDHAV